MRVLQVTQRFPPAIGGVEEHVRHLAQGLLAHGDEVEVATSDLRKDVPFERLGAADGGFPFPVHRARAIRIAPLRHGLENVAPAMLRHVLSGRWDILHGHAYGRFPTFAAAVGGALDRSALVITAHSDPGLGSTSKRLFDWAVPPATLRMADRVIALTATEAHHLRRLGVSAERIRIIPNGVDPGEFASLPAPGTNADETTILFVGRCDLRQKGLEYLVRAFALLERKRKVRLRIVGEDWGGVAELRSLSRVLGVDHRIEFVGPLPRDELVRSYGSADLFVLPSLFEPFGIVLLEAMAAGVPVVASRVGGIVGVVEDGKTGLLVPPADPRSLAEALGRLISDPSLRHRMGTAGRKMAMAHSWDRLIPRILDVYEEAVLERGRRRAG